MPEGGRGSIEGRSIVEERRGSVESFYKPEDLPPPPPEVQYVKWLEFKGFR